MNKKPEEKKTKRLASANKNINSRAIGIWQRRMMGKQMQEIAEELNIHETTVWRNIRAVEQSGVMQDKIEIELAKQRELWGLALAGLIVNLKNADMQAIEKLFKYTGLWLDKIEVLGKVKPDDQQKRMMESVEKLLKIQAPEPKKVNPPKTEIDMDKYPVQYHYCDHPKDQCAEIKQAGGCMVDPAEETTKFDLETIIPKGCTCHWTKDGAHTIEDHCPVHGELVQGTDGQEKCSCSYTSGRTLPVKHIIDPTCPVHRDRKHDKIKPEGETWVISCPWGNKHYCDQPKEECLTIREDGNCPVHGKEKEGGTPTTGGVKE